MASAKQATVWTIAQAYAFVSSGLSCPVLCDVQGLNSELLGQLVEARKEQVVKVRPVGDLLAMQVLYKWVE